MEKQLPKNWVETELGSILSLKNGYAFKTSDYIEIGIPIVRISNIQDGKIELERSISVKESLIKDDFVIKRGDILIAMSGATTGKYGIFNEDVIALQNQRVGNLKPHSKELSNKRYIYYLLGSLKKEIEDRAYGGAQPNISPKLIEGISINLPPLAEQNRIVAKLDNLFQQLDTIKTSMTAIPVLLKNFRQQLLTQAVTGKLTEEWRKGKDLESALNTIIENRNNHYENLVKENKKRGLKIPKKLDYTEYENFELSNSYKLPNYWLKSNLKNIADLITDGEHATPKRTDEGYYLLSARNVQNGFISLSNVDYVPKEEYERIKNRCNPEFKDILISCSGTVGRVSIVPKNLEFVMVRSAALVKFQSNTKISKFIEYVLRSDFGQSQILKLQKSTAQANLFLAPIGKIVVPVPSLSEQQEIVNRVESLFAKADAIEEQYKSLKIKIDNLPQAILHKAFKGELTEQLDSDGDAKDLLKQIQELKNSAVKPKKATAKKVRNYSEEDGVLGMVAETKEELQSKVIKLKPTNSEIYKRTLLAAEIVYQLKDTNTLGHLKLQKMLYLCQEIGSMNLPMNFLKQAMGPYDNQLARSIDKQFVIKKWFEYQNGALLKYKPLENCGSHKEDFQKYFETEVEQINYLINKFKKFTSNQIEAVATLYACWKEAIEQKELITDKLIITKFYQWSKEKEKFREENMIKALDWMRRNGVEPK